MPQNGAPNKGPTGVPNGIPNGRHSDANAARNNRLSSWKEIANYLDCNKRTCLRWEKSFGLPVHRLEGPKKSRVFAFRDEIDRWQRGKSSLFNGKAGGLRTPGRRKSVAISIWAAAILIILAAAILTALIFSVPRAPDDFRIDGSDLVILNERGKELWRHTTGVKNLASEKLYRTHFQRKGRTEEGHSTLPNLILEDIDNDGKVEVLFNILAEDNFGGGSVLCFSQKGKRLWEFEMGRPLEFGETRFSGDFCVRGFGVCDLDGDGTKEVVVVAHQWGRFPTRLAVLSAEGKLLGDFWNSGQLIDIIFYDLDRDGRKEILAGGTNNEYGQGALVVFDSADIRGCSPQTDERYAWKDIEPGSELYYIRIPRADAESVDYYPLECILRIVIHKNMEFSVLLSQSNLEFVFDHRMNAREVRSSHGFQILHENARRAGKVSSVLDAAYFENLRRSVLYWNGAEWVNTHAMNQRGGQILNH